MDVSGLGSLLKELLLAVYLILCVFSKGLCPRGSFKKEKGPQEKNTNQTYWISRDFNQVLKNSDFEGTMFRLSQTLKHLDQISAGQSDLVNI